MKGYTAIIIVLSVLFTATIAMAIYYFMQAKNTIKAAQTPKPVSHGSYDIKDLYNAFSE